MDNLGMTNFFRELGKERPARESPPFSGENDGDISRPSSHDLEAHAATGGGLCGASSAGSHETGARLYDHLKDDNDNVDSDMDMEDMTEYIKYLHKDDPIFCDETSLWTDVSEDEYDGYNSNNNN